MFAGRYPARTGKNARREKTILKDRSFFRRVEGGMDRARVLELLEKKERAQAEFDAARRALDGHDAARVRIEHHYCIALRSRDEAEQELADALGLRLG